MLSIYFIKTSKSINKTKFVTISLFTLLVTLNDNLVAPIITDDTVGTISYSIDGIEYKSDLLAGSTVYAKTDISIYLIVAGLAILLFAIILMPKKRHSKKSRHKN